MQTIWFLYLPNIGADGLPKQKQYDTCKNVFIHIFFKKKQGKKKLPSFWKKSEIRCLKTFGGYILNTSFLCFHRLLLNNMLYF